MKISAIIILLFMPMLSVAQNYQNMKEEDMQKMMQQMQKMQSCMQNIDQEKMKELEQLSYKAMEEIESLCDSGKRDEAQEKAISFGKDLAKDPTMQAMRKCSEMIEGKMPKMPFMDPEKDRTSGHVCD